MGTLTHTLGISLALGAALSGAAHTLLVRAGTDEGRAFDAVLVGTIVNVVILLPLVAIAYYPEYGLTRRSVLSFVAAGVIGTLMGRAFMYISIDRIGASRTAPIVASRALISTALGVVILRETLTAMHGIGVALVVGGVGVIAWETGQENPENLSRRDLLIGMTIPFVAAVAFGVEPIFANFGFSDGTPAVVGLLVKTVAASIGFILYMWWRRALPKANTLRDDDMQWFVLAGVAYTLFLLGYYLAIEIAPVSVVIPIISTNTLFVVGLSALFVPDRLERVTWHLIVSSVVVVVGVVFITFYG